MTLETVPAGQVSDGFGVVIFVPAIANIAAPTALEINAVGSKHLTYSIEAGGYKHTISVNQVKINRLTLAQIIQQDGTVEDSLEITYAYNQTASDVARLALPVGTVGFIVERWAIGNGTAIAAADVVHVIPIKASVQKPDAPVANQELTITQALNVTGTVQRFVSVA